MRHKDLEQGQEFTLEGGLYEVIAVWGRIIYCYVLDKRGRRIEDVDDLYEGYKTTMFSDMRFHREHYTQEDKELDDLL